MSQPIYRNERPSKKALHEDVRTSDVGAAVGCSDFPTD